MNNSPDKQSPSGLKICIASSGLGHITRGVESWAEDLGRALAGRGERVVLCKGAGKANADYERVVPCWTRNSRATKQLLRYLPHSIGWRLGVGSSYGVEQTTFAWNLLRWLRDEPVDVVHVQDPQLALCMQRAGRMKLISAKTVFGHVTEEPLELLKKFRYLQHVAPWHQSEAAKKEVESPDWTMIPNFIDTHQFQPGESCELRAELSIAPDTPVLLAASAIKKAHKRIDYLIDELAQVARLRPELPFVAVFVGGRERDTDELIRYGRQQLGDRVRFAVQFPRERMPEMYRLASIFLHGSLFEMFGTVLLEAMASGVPCITHQHPVMSWVVGEGGTALDLSQAGNLTQAVLEVLENPASLQEMRIAARQRVCREYSQEVVVERMLEYYRQVAQSH